ncbi:MAG: S8 family serine peptidase, partial [Planctomycetota bacterium]
GNNGDGDQEYGWDNDVVEQANYPASYDLDNIISVAATDQNDTLVSVANWDWGSNYGAISVDVVAPGNEIFSTKSGDNYGYSSGTSMATPSVAGLAALIWAEDLSQNGNVTFTYDQVKNRILNGVDVLTRLAGKILMAGRINAQNSLDFSITVPDGAPGGLEARATSSNRIDLSWRDFSSDESGFKIVRAINENGTYSHVGTAAANVESYADVTVNDLTTYYYRVLAFNVAGATAASNTVSATTPFAAPDNLLAFTVSSSRVDLFWADNSSGESGYRIERKTGPTGTYSEIATVGTNDDTYADTGLGTSTTYYYRVRAFNDNGVSPYSNEVSAETHSALSASSVSTDGGGGGGCFISAGEHRILSTLWLLLLAFILVGFVAWLGMPRRITIKGTFKNCLSTRLLRYAPILILKILPVFLRVRILACLVLRPISLSFEIPSSFTDSWGIFALSLGSREVSMKL